MTTAAPSPELQRLVDPWEFGVASQKPPNDTERSKGSEFATWSLTLIDEVPGPSIGDAIEYIEWLGLDWRDFRTTMISESLVGEIYTTEFSVSGPPDLVEHLSNAHEIRKRIREADDGWDIKVG